MKNQVINVGLMTTLVLSLSGNVWAQSGKPSATKAAPRPAAAAPEPPPPKEPERDAMLRVACDAESASAEVFINDEFKGECPVDIALPAGTFQLRVVKTVDGDRERVFASELRLAAHTVSRRDVVLGAPQLNAAGKKKEDERLAEERKAEEARQAAAKKALEEKQALEIKAKGERVDAWNSMLEKINAGDGAAMMAMANVFESGNAEHSLPKDPVQALAWRIKAAQVEHVPAYALVGQAYEYGLGTKVHMGEALKYYAKSANAGDPVGMAGLGAMHFNGTTGDARNPIVAAHWLAKAAAMGNARAMNGMATLQLHGLGNLPTSASVQEVMAQKQSAADAGDLLALVEMGTRYLLGQLVIKDEGRGRAMVDRAVSLGSHRAMAVAGVLTTTGQGYTKDPAKATQLLRSATSGEDAMALNQLAAAETNAAQSIVLFKRAVSAPVPSAIAMGNLAKGLTEGLWGFPRDEAEGAAWARKGALLGSARARDVCNKHRLNCESSWLRQTDWSSVSFFEI